MRNDGNGSDLGLKTSPFSSSPIKALSRLQKKIINPQSWQYQFASPISETTGRLFFKVKYLLLVKEESRFTMSDVNVCLVYNTQGKDFVNHCLVN